MRLKFGPTTNSSAIMEDQVVEEIENSQVLEMKNVVIYPNPMGRSNEIRFTTDENYQTHSDVYIFDQIGKIVYSTLNIELNQFENKIELNKELTPGSYFIRIVSGETTHTERFSVIEN